MDGWMDGWMIFDVILMLKDIGSHAVMYAVKLVMHHKRCKMAYHKYEVT